VRDLRVENVTATGINFSAGIRPDMLLACRELTPMGSLI